MRRLFGAFLFWFFAAEIAFGYTALASFSFQGVGSWAQPLISSGTTLPAPSTVATGDLFILFDSTNATLYRMASGSWRGPATSSGDASSLQSVAVSSDPPASGQALVYDGTDWGPATISADSGDATSIQSVAVDSTAPASGQCLIYNGGTSQYEPMAVSVAGDVATKGGLLAHTEATSDPHGADMSITNSLTVQNVFIDGWTGQCALLLTEDGFTASDGAVICASWSTGPLLSAIYAPASCTTSVGVATGSNGTYLYAVLAGISVFNLESTANASPGSILLTSDSEPGRVEPASDPITDKERPRRVGVATAFGSGDGGTVTGIVGR